MIVWGVVLKCGEWLRTFGFLCFLLNSNSSRVSSNHNNLAKAFSLSIAMISFFKIEGQTEEKRKGVRRKRQEKEMNEKW